MALYPGAVKRLIPRHNRVAIARYRRVNLHVAVSNGYSLYGHFAKAAVCSHFYVRDSGVVEQYIDTRFMSKADYHGNDSTISIETEGGVTNVNSEEWTDEQVIAIVQLWMWLRKTHDIENRIATGTNTTAASEGLSWHRLGVQGNFAGRPGLASKSYGGIKYSLSKGKECPGDAKINQIPEIFALSNGDLKPVASKPSRPAPVKVPTTKPTATKMWPERDLPLTGIHTSESHKAWVTVLAAEGFKNKDLTVNIQNFLANKTGKLGKKYYTGKVDGKFYGMTVEALQEFLQDRDYIPNGSGYIDRSRGGVTIKGEKKFLNGQRKYHIKK